MRVSDEARKALAAGFEEIVQQFKLPRAFPLPVLEAMQAIVSRCQLGARTCYRYERRDVTDMPFVTLDPAASTDLDQAFVLEQDGDAILLHYALADLSAFLGDDDAIESEAWQRGVTIYGINKKIPLYPAELSQGLASLLPDGPRPAMLVTVGIQADGTLSFKSIERVVCASSAKLAYDSVEIDTLPYLEEFAKRMWVNEAERGAVRVEFPQQEVIVDAEAPGGVRLALRAQNYAESVNATLSLAVNLALGRLCKDAGVGLFRVMDEPNPQAIELLRRSASVLGIQWESGESLRDVQRRMDPNNATHQRFLLEARRSGGRASYAAYSADKSPWHAAIGGVYVHATAPMRRLADRYVLDLSYQIANGQSVEQGMLAKIGELPTVMQRFEARAANVDQAVIDLVEAVSLQHRIGETIDAEVIDAQLGIVQTVDSAVRSKILRLPAGVKAGDRVSVRIDAADPIKRRVSLSIVS